MRAEAKDSEVIVKGSGALDPEPAITAKLVQSTIEKSWSRYEIPICHAVSRSAALTDSITATPLRSASQNRCATWRRIR